MAATTSSRVRRGASDWHEILSRFAASGLSQAAFCRREGLALSTFGYWKRRLAAGDERTASSPKPAVIDLGALEERPAGWEVEIALGDGVSLTLRRR